MIPPVVAASGAIASGGNLGETKASVAAGRAKAQASQPKRATATPAKGHARNVPKDKDVELIGALLAHVAAPATAQAPKTPARKQQAVAASPARTAARRDRGTPNERGLARQPGGVPTESLVKQCRSLGILEGELCRLRVCSDLWGKDPACPSSALTASNS